MKKTLLYVVVACVGLMTVSCKDSNKSEDPKTTDNPYAYLRVSDLMPMFLTPLAQAEAIVLKMGYKGGWQIVNGEGAYLYTSPSQKDSIFLDTAADGSVCYVQYIAEGKGVVPSDAKGWLSHLPENVTLPERVATLVKSNYAPFFDSYLEKPNESGIRCTAYQEYLNNVQSLVSGVSVEAVWGAGGVPNDYPSGYYGNIVMTYKFENNKDRALLSLAGFYHEQHILGDLE